MCFVCVYILKKQKKKKNSRFPKFSQKKRKIFKKKKKIFGLGTLDFLVTFSKKPIFFFQRFQDSLKSSFQNDT